MVANSGIEMEPPPSEDFQNQALFGLPVLRPPNFSYPFGLLTTAGGPPTASNPMQHLFVKAETGERIRSSCSAIRRR